MTTLQPAAAERDLTRDGLIVLCAGNCYNQVKVADHHVAERLAQHAPVLYIDPPMSRLSARHDPRLAPALEGPRLRYEAAGFWRLTPVVLPFGMRPGMVRVTEFLVRRMAARAVKRIGPDVQAVISAWTTIDMFGTCGEQLRVWWAQDDFAAGAGLMNTHAKSIAAGEAARAAQCDVVVAANPQVAERWTRAGHDVTLIPYGSDPETFAGVEYATPAPGIALAPPVAVLVGQFNDRVEPTLLEAVADHGISLLLVGPAGADTVWLHRLNERPNVTWVGPQPFDALSGYLAHASVGLVPYTHSAFNRASFPLKTLEYLSAGLPAVSTGLPATLWLDPGDPELIAIAEGPEAYADAVAAALALPLTPELRERRRAFARAHSYERRAADFLATIDRHLAAR